MAQKNANKITKNAENEKLTKTHNYPSVTPIRYWRFLVVLCESHSAYQYHLFVCRSKQTKPEKSIQTTPKPKTNQIKPNQTKPNQHKPDQLKPTEQKQTKPNKTQPNQTTTNQPNQTKRPKHKLNQPSPTLTFS